MTQETENTTNRGMQWMAYALAGIGVLVVAVVDYLTGNEIRLFPLYFPPLLLASWYLPLRSAMFMALVAAVAWAIVHFVDGPDYTQAYAWAINAALHAVTFLLVAWLFAEMHRLQRRASRLRRTDPLTGLPDSRSFFDRAGSVLAVCHRDNLPATLAYIDLENFRNAKHTQGHKAGDKLLRKVADVLQENLRTSDIAARLDGGEFAVLLPETGEESAAIALEKVRSRLARDEDFLAGDVTTTIGAVSCRSAPKDINQMLKAADKVMYRVKASAKDHVIVQGMEAA